MRPVELILGMILATALLPNGPTAATAAGAGKQILSHRGGKAADISERGSANSNPQWSADPEKGWIRAESQHELHRQSRESRETHRPSTKEKNNEKPTSSLPR
jgi:hypothetical protein